MKLLGSDRQRFELRILGYQFPELENEDYDSNWLIIETNVDHPDGHWISQAPCLLTYEVTRLANWLDKIVKSEEVDPEEYFFEPNLRVWLWNANTQEKKIRIYFELESRPEWAPADGGGIEDVRIYDGAWLEYEAVENPEPPSQTAPPSSQDAS